MARTRNLVVVLVVASLTLILWDLRTSDAALRSAARQVVTPLQRTATAVFAPFGAWARQVQSFDDPQTRRQAAEAISVTAPPGWATAAGRVVAAEISGSRAVVTIDAGSSAGIRPGNAVLAPGGLVGRIQQVSPGAATVQLVTDPQSTIGVRVLPSREMGVVTGRGMGQDLQLELLNPAARVTASDAVITLGSTSRDGIPPGLPIGTVVGLDTEPVGSGRAGDAAPVTGTTTLDMLVVLTERR